MVQMISFYSMEFINLNLLLHAPTATLDLLLCLLKTVDNQRQPREDHFTETVPLDHYKDKDRHD